MNLFCWIPLEHDATSFYRALQPISQLRKLIPELNIFHAGQEINMKHLAHMDVVFLQRPSTQGQLEVMQYCKKLGVKVWVEYDDNFWCVPDSNPSAAIIKKEVTQKVMLDLLNGADVISVSTQQLALDISKFLKIEPGKEKKIYTIPNAFNDYLFKEKPAFKKHNLITWRGTQSHQRDLAEFAPFIIKAAKENPTWLFTFMGYNPYFIIEALPHQAKHIEGLEIFQYHQVLRETFPNLIMVTLSDNPFNRCKSNIAWIEGTYAGAVCLGPSWEEWEKPGIVNYSDPATFGSILSDILQHGAIPSGEKLHKLSWEFIMDNLRLSQVNMHRATLLLELLGRK